MPKNDDKKQYGFKKGAMIISDDRGQIHVRAWPNPAAHTRLWHNKWKTFSPEFRLFSPNRTAPRHPDSQMLLPIQDKAADISITSSPANKNRTYSALRSTVPDAVSELVEVFRNHQWNLIRFAFHIDQVALDLLASNPVLAFMLANHKWYSEIMGLPDYLEKAKRLACMKQKELLAKLKYPSSKSVVNLIKKLRPESATPEYLESLREHLAHEEIRTMLTRLDSVNAGVLGILGNAKLAGTFDHNLLREVALVPRENYYAFTMHTLEEVRYMCKNGRPRRDPPVFSSLKRLEEFHEELSVGFVRVSKYKVRYCKIPKPPLPGTDTIVPLNTPLKIQKEGEEQHNCVGSYAPRVSKGGMYIYKILAPERATLSIVRDAGGTWRIGELRRDRNQNVNEETTRIVDAWLEGNSLSA